jgi:hypothetical protein
MRRNRTIALLIALVLVLAMAACSSAPSVADDKAACINNERLIKSAMGLFNADSGLNAPISDVVDKLHLKCPVGGTYSYDATSGVVSCTVNGKLYTSFH